MSGDSPLARLLARLDGVEDHGDHYTARCKGHNDHNPSLDIKEVEENGQKKVLLFCRAGCDTEAVIKELGLGWEDLFSKTGSSGPKKSGWIVATYDYTDATGNLVHQTVRYEPKGFKQRRPDGDKGWIWNLKGIESVLYRLPEVLEARLKGEAVYVFEGEKDCDRARQELGVTATTCPMGANKWRDSHTHTLAGADVVLVSDNDEAGRKHVLKGAESLLGVAASVKVLDLPGLPDKGDLSDWIEAGGTKVEFDALVEEAPEFHSGHIGGKFGRNEFSPTRIFSERR